LALAKCHASAKPQAENRQLFFKGFQAITEVRMATSRAIKPKRDDTLLTNWEPQPERAPSIERADQPTFARFLAMGGLFFLVLGALIMMAPTWQRSPALIPPAIGFMLVTLGIISILFHAFAEKDFQFRRLYGFVGLALLASGIFLRLIAFKSERAMTWPITLSGAEVVFFGSIPAFLLGLTILFAVIRNETDAYFRALLVNALGGLGALLIAFSLLMALRDAAHLYFPTEGATLMLLGLLYVAGYIGTQDSRSERGYYAGLALGAVGVVSFTIAVVRSLIPESPYLVPSGIILMSISLIFMVVALGICADWPVVVVARREFAGYLFTPVAHLVLVGQLLCAAATFFEMLLKIEGRPIPVSPVFVYMLNLMPVIVQTVLVPALTMRLMSEERRSGTLEVLLTAPVSEVSVVVGKFLACWIFYVLLWIPFWIFLIALRYMGMEEFDCRPLLSFNVALISTSAGFIAMGLFFSALTSNQIIAAVFTFVGMLAHLFLYLISQMLETGTIADLASQVNYIDFWNTALYGTLSPRYIAYHFSLAFFFLFITVKLLESRKWR
jgi:ABC-2 type transport system permease protein